MALITVVYAAPATVAEIKPNKRAPFYAALILCIAGLLGMVVTGDAFNVFVFLEVSSISTYTLVAMGAARDRRALSAAYNYLILGSIGATFFVIGIGFLYMETGTLNMADMARILADLDGGSRVSKVAFGFIVIGLGLKLAMFPFMYGCPGPMLIHRHRSRHSWRRPRPRRRFIFFCVSLSLFSTLTLPMSQIS